MSATVTDVIDPPVREYPPGFRPRRGLNWGYLGLLYTSFYMCRYNLSIANKSISDQYHFSYSQMSSILTAWTLAYAFGQIFNGLLTDRIGGKRAMLIGAVGTIIMNILFGAASAWGLLGVFMAIRGIDGYLQSFGAPGMTKIKTAWFSKTERGGFAGIFGFMINLGRFGIFQLGPALLAGFTLLGMIHVPALHWKWLFWAPSIVCFVVACAMAIAIKETPEENGFLPVEAYTIKPAGQDMLMKIAVGCLLAALGAGLLWYLNSRGVLGALDIGLILILCIVLIFVVLHVLAAVRTPAEILRATTTAEAAAETTRANIWSVLFVIMRNPAVWLVAAAYACTGAVRQPVDQWFPRYMQEVHHTDMKSAQFQFLAFLIPFVASAGSLLSGYVSDKLFQGARAPVAGALYLIEAVIVFLAAQFHTANAAVVFFVLISFTANSTHSILGTAAAMDIGGRKMTGFASGLIDSFQYFGSSLGLFLLGKLLDRSWDYYFYFMVPFGLIGFTLMVLGRGVIARGSQR
ncbi:MAG TPA: MFS transporter [Tepidisphaeraceae bacterium]|jgi:sugar phosphate permease